MVILQTPILSSSPPAVLLLKFSRLKISIHSIKTLTLAVVAYAIDYNQQSLTPIVTGQSNKLAKVSRLETQDGGLLSPLHTLHDLTFLSFKRQYHNGCTMHRAQDEGKASALGEFNK